VTAPDPAAGLDSVLAETLPAAAASEAADVTAEACNVADTPGGVKTRGVRFRFGPGQVTVTFPAVRETWSAEAGQLAASVHDLAAQLRSAQPGDLIRNFPALAARMVAPPPGGMLPGAEGWLVAVRLAEAARMVLEDAALAGDLTARRVLPLTRRTRFLLLSAPARFPRETWPVLRAFGSLDGSLAVLAARAEQARIEWALDLLNHDEHPELRLLTPTTLDTELRRLLFTGGEPGSPLLYPAAVVVPAPSTPTAAGTHPTPPRRDEEGLRIWLTQEAFLPRLMLGTAWRALRPAAGIWPFALLGLLAVVGASPVLTLTPWGTQHTVGVLRAVAAASAFLYAAVTCLALRRPATASLWCLRLPAGAAIGVVALISIDDGWATRNGWAWLWASLALLGASVGYLCFEALGHGVPRGWVLARRVSAVAALGFAHAVAVVALTLAAIVPAIKPGLARTLSGPHALAAGQLLTLAGSVALAAGVLLQVLWDDRPVTYPLTHLPWKGRTR
jgi:hypothetical protein